MPSRSELLITEPGRAAELLRSGGLVAIPTETVYGLGADAEQAAAVARIFAVKGRPSDHPLIVHLAGIEDVDGWVGRLAHEADTAFRSLAEACWPGPLTILVDRGPRVLDVVTGGRSTVGLRVPAHPLTTDVLQRLGGGIAAPSANRFGKVSPTTAEHVLSDLGDLLDPGRDAILDGGACPIGVESTIVDLTVSPPQLLRAGAITATQIAAILETPVADASGPSRASGMLIAHYAPTCEVVLADSRQRAEALLEQRQASGQRAALLDRSDDLVLAARHLYADLRAADAAGLDALVVVQPPPEGLGHALRDRLAKAAVGSRR